MKNSGSCRHRTYSSQWWSVHEHPSIYRKIQAVQWTSSYWKTSYVV